MKKCPVRDVDDVDSEEVLILTLLTVVSSLGRSHQLFGSSGDRCHQCCESLTASESGLAHRDVPYNLAYATEEPLMIQLNDDSKIESHPGATVLQSPVQHDVNVADKVRASNCGPPGKEQQTCYTQTAIN
ncbi:hypothetical protein Fot_15146 [Forsythia ovata]|uniref:Uncharacterized protein n=1 Tax=Forsythia ovata TaxID=205694 RepID=A0ABD1WAW7_9LAMI